MVRYYRKLWDLIIKTATENAEPGVVFWDKVVNYSPSANYENQRPACLNPCGEQALPGDKNHTGTCILMNINLKSFVNNKFEDDCFFDFPCPDFNG